MTRPRRLPPVVAAAVRKARKPNPLVEAHGAESMPELLLLHRMGLYGLPAPVTQYSIVPGRRFRWDVAFPDYKVAVEVQGGQYMGGRHNRVAGYEADCEKSALAQILGWICLAVTPGMITHETAVPLVAAALITRGWAP